MFGVLERNPKWDGGGGLVLRCGAEGCMVVRGVLL
jgi:hypothetical protein